MIKPINNKDHHIYLHKLKQSLKIKPKALKPSLSILRQAPLPKREPNKHTRTHSATTQS